MTTFPKLVTNVWRRKRQRRVFTLSGFGRWVAIPLFLFALVIPLSAYPGQDELTASYHVELLGTAPPRVVVQATLPSDGGSLVMATSRPGDVPEVADAGWPGLVRNLTVRDAEGRDVAVTPAGPAGWALAHPVRGRLTLRYEIDLAPLAQRGWPAAREAAFADRDHVVLIGRSLFIMTPGQRTSEVRFVLPDGWNVAAPWTAIHGVRSSALIPSADGLTENLVAFVRGSPDGLKVAGFDLKVVALGHWQAARKEIRHAVGAVLERLVDMIGFNDHVDYLVVLLPQVESGGESFRASFALTSKEVPSRSNVGDWGNLIAHELFHQWNGWKLRGADYASSQWFQEGFTEYAANIALVSAGLTRSQAFYDKLAEHVTNYRRLKTPLDAPGTHKGPPLYSGGALVAFIWDATIREATGGERGVPDVLRALLRSTEDGTRGYEWADIHAALESVSPGDWSEFYERFIHGSEPLPLADAFARIGLHMSEGNGGTARIEEDPAATVTTRSARRALMHGKSAGR